MKKIGIFREWIRSNRQFFRSLQHQAYIHGGIAAAETLPQRVLQNSQPIFVISTGRVGTMLLAKLFETCKNTEVFHEAQPDMIFAGRYAFENPQNLEWMKGAAVSGRYELIRDSYLKGKRYVETNNRLTFLSPALAELFPKARFIHLLRNPHSFIKSGLQRDWYSGKTITDEGRIVRGDDNFEMLSTADKVAWLWNMTNQFCEDFKTQFGKSRAFTIKSESLFHSTKDTCELFDWLELKPPNQIYLEKLLRRPMNKSKPNKTTTEINFDTKLTPLAPLYYPDQY